MLSRAASEIAISVGQHSIAGRKSRNDDSYGVLLPEKALLATKGVAIAIADGMSSSEAAKEASETCVRSFLDDYFATPPSWTVKTSVERVLSAANRWMQSQSEALSAEGRGMVSTFSGAVLKSSMAHIFHVGDSRIYLLRDRHIERLTNDHRVRVSRQQEYLSRAFGMERDLAVDYRKLPVERGDILVFTTDGVHDFLSGGADREHHPLDAKRSERSGGAHCFGGFRPEQPGQSHLPDRKDRRSRRAPINRRNPNGCPPCRSRGNFSPAATSKATQSSANCI